LNPNTATQRARPLLKEPAPSKRDAPSYLYVSGFVANSVAITVCVLSGNVGWSVPLMVIQGFFFMGLLELLHQAVHRNFVTGRTGNEILGTLAGALIGYNMVTYRYFHLVHHRHTCDQADPEGLLYAHSPHTRWSALGAPIAQAWVAFSINQLADRYVTAERRREWQRCRWIVLLVMAALASLAIAFPSVFIAVYLVPFCLFAWMDFFFSQAEHYGAPIRSEGERVDVATVSYDIRIPVWLSHLMLNRNLHRVHHVWPRTRWFDAPARLSQLDEQRPGRVRSLPIFLTEWMRAGPRLWQ
ncbi:MAG TPA: fatty acid desaturase, partial [Dongiaceae bacterium]|nr:fatty acid desaturase [Dongiaceae bacterium]